MILGNCPPTVRTPSVAQPNIREFKIRRLWTTTTVKHATAHGQNHVTLVVVENGQNVFFSIKVNRKASKDIKYETRFASISYVEPREISKGIKIISGLCCEWSHLFLYIRSRTKLSGKSWKWRGFTAWTNPVISPTLLTYSSWRPWSNQVEGATTFQAVWSANLPFSIARCLPMLPSIKFSVQSAVVISITSVDFLKRSRKWLILWFRVHESCGRRPRSRCCLHQPSSITFSIWEISVEFGRYDNVVDALLMLDSFTLERQEFSVD